MDQEEDLQLDIFEDAAPKFELKAGQQEAFDWLVPFCTGDSTGFRKVLLEGYAGTGKTWTINRVVEEVKRRMPSLVFGMTAPTHKAVRQLKKHSELKDELDFGTIHSYLGLKEKQIPDPKNKNKFIISYEPDWTSNKQKRIDGINILIIDESSMLGDVLYGYIEDYLHSRRDLKVIFMGKSFAHIKSL